MTVSSLRPWWGRAGFPAAAGRALCLTLLSLGGPRSLVSQSLTAEQWRDDIRFAATAIRRIHPAPFGQISEAALDSMVGALEGNLGRVPDASIAAGLMRIVAAIGDGHTELQPGGRVFTADRWYPVRLERLPDGIFVTAVGRSFERLLGGRVLAIGDLPADTAWWRAERLSAADNAFSRIAGASTLFMMPEIVAAVGVAGGEAMRLLVETAGRDTVTAIITPVRDAFAPERDVVGVAGGGLALPVGSPADHDLSFRHRDATYWGTVTPDARLYARINRMDDARDSVVLEGTRRRLGLRAFYEELFAIIDGGRARSLIIDLRGNAGGNNSFALPLVAGIVARPTLNQEGRVFVLTSRHTFSAAMNLASLLEFWTEAVFVGEPPGGSPLHYGDPVELDLPHSGMRLRVSTLHWDLGVYPTDVRAVMEPDLAAPFRVEDLRSGRDPALRAVAAWRPEGTVRAILRRTRASEGAAAVRARFHGIRDTASLPTPWGGYADALVESAWDALRGGGTPAEIFSAFELATEEYPDVASTWANLGRVYGFWGRWADAAAAYARAAALHPHDDGVRRLAAAMQAHLR